MESQSILMLSCRNSILVHRISKNFYKNLKSIIVRNDNFNLQLERSYQGQLNLHLSYDLIPKRSYYVSKCFLSHANRVFMPVEEFVQSNKDGKPKTRNSNISLRFVSVNMLVNSKKNLIVSNNKNIKFV